MKCPYCKAKQDPATGHCATPGCSNVATTKRLGDLRGIVEAVNEACTCGGGGPCECCPACEVFHGIKDMEVRT